MPPQPPSPAPAQEPALQQILPPKKQNTFLILVGTAAILAVLIYVGVRIFAPLLENSAQDSAKTGGFTIVKTNYKEIKDLHDVGGKLAYAFENTDGTSGVVYDGQVISSAYQKVGILPVAEVGGKLAYEAYNGDKQIIVWNGQEYGGQYDMALSPTDVGGKLAYLAQKGKGGDPNLQQIVVWDGKEYGTEFTQTNDILDFEGKLAFHGKKDSGEYIVVGDKQYGPFGWIHWLQEREGHSVSQALMTYNTSSYVVDGEITGGAYVQLTGIYAFIDGKFAFSALQHDQQHTTIVYDGKEVGTGASYEAGPYNIGGKLAYVAANADGTSQLIVGGQAVGPAMSGNIHNVDVSKGRRVAIQVHDGGRTCGSNLVHGPIYLDGEKVYEGCSSNPFGFFGEKLLFWTQENGRKALWYDGNKIGQGFYGYNYLELVNGKLNIAAFDSGVKYSLLVEQ